MIDVVNRVFDRLESNKVMPKLPGIAEVWRKRFQTHTTARDFPGYCVLQTASQADEDESQPVETLQYAAAEVARLHRESPGASIGILVRKNQAVARMIYELRHTHGIEASEEGGNPLLDSAAVQLVLSLLAIADHPGDTIARFHVAHSALGADRGLSRLRRRPRRPAVVVGNPPIPIGTRLWGDDLSLGAGTHAVLQRTRTHAADATGQFGLSL